MRAIITGSVKAFRYVDLKGSAKSGQIDLLQAGDEKHPTKIIQIYIPSGAYCRLILQELETGSPIVSFLSWLTFGKETEIEVMELLSITN